MLSSKPTVCRVEGSSCARLRPVNNSSSSFKRSILNIHAVTHTCFQVTDAALLSRDRGASNPDLRRSAVHTLTTEQMEIRKEL